jgi:hypothetical protein
MLFVNRAAWAHCLEQAARVMAMGPSEFLTDEELAALEGRASPEGVIV